MDKPFQFSGSGKGLTCHMVSPDTLPQAFLLLRKVTHPGLDSCGRQGCTPGTSYIAGRTTDAPVSTGQPRTGQAQHERLRAQRKELQREGGREAGPTVHTLDMRHTYLHSLDSEVYGSEQSLCWLAI